jgi:hypothetical protein
MLLLLCNLIDWFSVWFHCNWYIYIGYDMTRKERVVDDMDMDTMFGLKSRGY